METKRLSPKAGALGLLLGFVVVLCAASIAPGEDWDDCPAIVVEGVTQEPGQDWFHISQNCTLTIEGIDEDSESGVPDGGDHLYNATTIWEGEFLDSKQGLENRWEPDNWTEGDEISVTVDDDPNTPDGTNTDDSSVDGPTFTLKAWEFAVTLSVQCTADPNQSSTVVVTETGYGTNVETSASIECTLAKGPVTAQTTKTGTCWTACDTADAPATQFGAAQANATWSIDTMPTEGVEAYNAVYRADVDANMSGSLIAETSDYDPDSGSNVDVGVLIQAAGVPGWAVEIITSIVNWKEECESAAGIGFGFNSDVLESCLGSVYEIEIASGANPNDDTRPFSHNPAAQQLTGTVATGPAKAQAKIDGKVEARGYRTEVLIEGEPIGCMHWHSEASIESTGSCTYECSNVRADPNSLQENDSRLID